VELHNVPQANMLMSSRWRFRTLLPAGVGTEQLLFAQADLLERWLFLLLTLTRGSARVDQNQNFLFIPDPHSDSCLLFINGGNQYRESLTIRRLALIYSTLASHGITCFGSWYVFPPGAFARPRSSLPEDAAPQLISRD
jgi:hypothetical protein